MREKILIQIGSRKLHLVKLIGAFIVLGSALMLLSDIYRLVSIASLVTGQAGQTVTLNFYGLIVKSSLQDLSMGVKSGLVLLPLAGTMFWAAVLVFGAVLYRTGGITLPIKEKVKKMKEEPEEKSEEEPEEKGRERYKEARDRYVCSECGEEFESERALHIHQTKSHGS